MNEEEYKEELVKRERIFNINLECAREATKQDTINFILNNSCPLFSVFNIKNCNCKWCYEFRKKWVK